MQTHKEIRIWKEDVSNGRTPSGRVDKADDAAALSAPGVVLKGEGIAGLITAINCAYEAIVEVPPTTLFWFDGQFFLHEALAQMEREFLIETEIIFFEEDVRTGKVGYNDLSYDSFADALLAARNNIIETMPILSKVEPACYRYDGKDYDTLAAARSAVNRSFWRDSL